MDWQLITQQITAITGEPFTVRHNSTVGGGCINQAVRLSDGQRHFFVKLNSANRLGMFEAEAEGLLALAAARAVRVPAVITAGVAGSQAYLVLEYLEMSGGGDRQAAIRLGEQLASMHAHQQRQFGWHRDNTIGSTPQPNSPTADWIEFWRRQRLGHQLQLAQRQGLASRVLRKGEALQDALPALFSGYAPQASVLHGDLWGGNWGEGPGGEPVIFDPAVYFGDRETDVAMTELFGGFDADFYAAYQAGWPLDPGYKIRRHLYNLYHVLNHFNLFGGGYASQAEGMVDLLLAELH